MAMTTLTPPAAMASSLAEELPSSRPGTILALAGGGVALDQVYAAPLE